MDLMRSSRVRWKRLSIIEEVDEPVVISELEDEDCSDRWLLLPEGLRFWNGLNCLFRPIKTNLTVLDRMGFIFAPYFLFPSFYAPLKNMDNYFLWPF